MKKLVDDWIMLAEKYVKTASIIIMGCRPKDRRMISWNSQKT
jgi:hypothetical protein